MKPTILIISLVVGLSALFASSLHGIQDVSKNVRTIASIEPVSPGRFVRVQEFKVCESSYPEKQLAPYCTGFQPASLVQISQIKTMRIYEYRNCESSHSGLNSDGNPANLYEDCEKKVSEGCELIIQPGNERIQVKNKCGSWGKVSL